MVRKWYIGAGRSLFIFKYIMLWIGVNQDCATQRHPEAVVKFIGSFTLTLSFLNQLQLFFLQIYEGFHAAF